MLLTLEQFAEKYPWPSASALRNWAYRSKKNKKLASLSRCFKKVGARVLIDDAAFFQAVAEMNSTEEKVF
jgi:hypothetical protein